MTRAAILLTTFILVHPVFSQIRQTEPTESSVAQELDEVVIDGASRLPLWKVTWRDHTLWILPVVAPLPRTERWRPADLYRLSDLIGESQEVYTEASIAVNVDANAATAAKVAAALRIPDGARQNDFLPLDLYDQLAEYKSRFGVADVQLELLRPSFAAIELRKRSLKQMRLDTDGGVHDVISSYADKHLVPLKSLARELTPKPGKIVGQLARVSRDDDVKCTRAQLGLLQIDLQDSAARGASWFAGNVAALQRDWENRQRVATDDSCQAIFGALGPTQQDIRTTQERSNRILTGALRKNRSTVALVLIDEVFDAQGIVAHLRKSGYKVEAP